MTRNKFSALSATIGLCLAVVLLCSGCGEKRFKPLVAPSFSLPLLEGNDEVSLAAYPGEVVYLAFWASWCIPCRQEMPYLAQLWERHQEEGFQVLAINVEEDVASAREFARRYELPFPVLRDADRAVANSYRVPGFPTHFIVDRRGNIRFSGVGFDLNDVRAVTQEVATLLAEE